MNMQTSVRRTPPRIAPSKHSLAAAYSALTAEPPERGLQLLDHVPFGHNICLARDAGMAPLIRPGDVVIYDTSTSVPEDDQLFVIEYPGMRGGRPGGPTERVIVEVFSKTINGDETWWTTSLRRPRSAADHRRLERQRIFHCSDGPWNIEQIMDRLIGRVVGILRQGETSYAR